MIIVMYNCSIDSKYTIAWALIAVLMMVFHLELSIKDYIDKNLDK
jgi:hypothetical protein